MRLLSLLALLAVSPNVDPVELKPFDPVDTAAGKVTRREAVGEDHPLRLYLNGETLLYQRDGSLELAYLIPQATAGGDDAVLVAVGSDVPTDKGCTKYLFVTAPKEGKASATSEFGDCSDQFSIQRTGPTVVVTFSAHNQSWTYQDGKLSAGAPEAPKKGKAKKKSKK